MPLTKAARAFERGLREHPRRSCRPGRNAVQDHVDRGLFEHTDDVDWFLICDLEDVGQMFRCAIERIGHLHRHAYRRYVDTGETVGIVRRGEDRLSQISSYLFRVDIEGGDGHNIGNRIATHLRDHQSGGVIRTGVVLQPLQQCARTVADAGDGEADGPGCHRHFPPGVGRFDWWGSPNATRARRPGERLRTYYPAAGLLGTPRLSTRVVYTKQRTTLFFLLSTTCAGVTLGARRGSYQLSVLSGTYRETVRNGAAPLKLARPTNIW